MLKRKVNNLSSEEKTNVIFKLIYNLSFDQLLDAKKIVGKKVFDDETWEELLENYNPEYYNILKDYEFHWKELYLDFLEIEKDKKEDLLADFILNGINNEELMIYSELQKLIQGYSINDLPQDLLISLT